MTLTELQARLNDAIGEISHLYIVKCDRRTWLGADDGKECNGYSAGYELKETKCPRCGNAAQDILELHCSFDYAGSPEELIQKVTKTVEISLDTSALTNE